MKTKSTLRRRSPHTIITLLISCVLLLSVSTNANAIILQIDFEGNISSAGSFLDPTGLFAQGDVLSGFWTVDTDTVDSSADPDRGTYSQSGSPSFQINIGTSTFQTSTSTIQILNDYTAGIGTIDAYDVLANNETSNIAGLSGLNMQFTFRDTQLPLDALDSDALLAGAPDLSMFDQINQVQGQLSGTYNDQLFFMNLGINSISVANVPEPATLLLFSVGLLGLGFSRHRKQV